MKKFMISLLAIGSLSLGQAVKAQNWSLTGNAGTDPATNFIGTTDSKVLKIKTNNQVRMYFKTNGDIGVGTITPSSKFHVNGVITATGGTSNDWNSAYSWGNHALAGYLTTETDPQVGSITTGYIPRWNGSALVTGNLYSSGTFLGLNATSAIGAAQFVVADTNGSYGGISVNSIAASGGLPFYGYAVNGVTSCWTYFKQSNSDFAIYNSGERMAVENDGDVRIGQPATTSSRLEVLGNSTITSPTLKVATNYTGTSDVRGIDATSISNPGYGIGVYGTGGYMGLRGVGDASTYTGFAYGVYGSASGTAGTRVGVYGAASGGTENWGGYFNTKSYMTELRVGSTTGATGYLLSVAGKIMCTELRVQNTSAWPDYVFADDYNLKSIDELEQHIKTEKHLPGVPSACEVEENGIAVGEMQKVMMEKIEELTLYIIELKKENEKLNNRVQSLERN